MKTKPTALIRAKPEDFEVIEIPKVSPSGSGEHLLVRLRKRGANTPWAATQLARWAGVPERSVSWAGLKDRHAVTEQWFSIHCLNADPDPATFEAEGCTLLEVHRHGRKLRRGALAGNRFRIVLRELDGQADVVAKQVPALATGFPNRFGPQRFGRGGRNLVLAQRWLSGGPPPRQRSQKGFLISAARSAIFNAILDRRVDLGVWDKPVAGDVMMLEGTGSRFSIDTVDDGILERCASGDVHPSAPMWGRGGTASSSEALVIEQSAMEAYLAMSQGLERIAEMERRPLRVIPRELGAEVLDPNTLAVGFELPAGAYATTLLGCLVEWRVPDSLSGETDAGED